MAHRPAAAQMTIDAEVHSVVYRKPGTDYTVLALQAVDGSRQRFRAFGPVPAEVPLREGQVWTLTGSWEDTRYGRQLRLSAMVPQRPVSSSALESLLASGLISGVGPERARRIITHFGTKAWDFLSTGSDRLMEVPGIGPGVFKTIVESWRQHQEQAALMARLCELGLSLALASKTLKHFGGTAEGIIQTNPYRLTEVRGVGFKTVDPLARRLGLKPTDPTRLRAGLREVLREAVTRGHCYLPVEKCQTDMAALLAVDGEPLEVAMRQACVDEETVLDAGRLYRHDLYQAERGVEEELVRRLGPPVRPWRGRCEERLTDSQRRAVEWSLTYPCSILAGLPGTGKSFTVGELVRVARETGERVVLAAPTGKAARRMTELSGQEATTIHRLLEFGPEGFRRHRGNPIDADLVVIDEASMIDLPLCRALLEAIPPHRRVLFVGDPYQLPSVGPGQVIRDLIVSGWLPVTTLTRIQRQAEQSAIVTLAHRIYGGQLPVLQNGTTGDVTLVMEEEPEALIPQLEREIRQALRRFAPVDIQVLAPMHRGTLGTEALNRAVRAVMNPDAKPQLGGFAVGDRVVQGVNNYTKDILNGEIGVIERMDPDDAVTIVRFGDRQVAYTTEELADLDLAFCLSVHEAQGSEFPCVIVVAHKQHYPLLRRELLYTAVTRAQTHLILAGSPEAFQMAVRRSEAERRFSALCAARDSRGPLGRVA